MHVQRVRYPAGAGFVHHDHDFAEVFCALDAPALHRSPGGDVALEAGAVGCVAPRVVHALAARADRGCTFLNIAFPATLLRRVLRDYPTLAPWWSEAWPTPHARLGDADRYALLAWADRLAQPGADALAVHAFLLDLSHRLHTTRGHAAARGGRPSAAPPAWLVETIAAAASPTAFPEGVRFLARHSGRGGAYINRLVRRHHGMTSNQLLNRLRMDHAAQRLRQGDDTIAAIATACGFATPAQFYRQFQRRFGIAPGSYREGRGSAL